MVVVNKETYENGEVALDIYPDTGEYFLTIDHFGMYATLDQLIDLQELLAAFVEEVKCQTATS